MSCIQLPGAAEDSLWRAVQAGQDKRYWISDRISADSNQHFGIVTYDVDGGRLRSSISTFPRQADEPVLCRSIG